MRSAKRLGPKSAGLGMGGFLHRLDLIFTDSKADVNTRVESDSRSAMSCKNDSFDKCPLGGLVLRSRIHPSSISTDPRVVAFTDSRMAGEAIGQQLEYEQLAYISSTLLKTFDSS